MFFGSSTEESIKRSANLETRPCGRVGGRGRCKLKESSLCLKYSVLNKLRRLLNRFFRKSSRLNHQTLNAPSMIVVVFIDIFILVNVFIGLNDISNWPLSPNQTQPCYSEWSNYRNEKNSGKDYELISRSISESVDRSIDGNGLRTEYYRRAQIGRLGRVSSVCLDYAGLQDGMRTPENQTAVKSIETQLNKVTRLEASNRSIRQQYDSTLLDRVAGQSPSQSINAVSAEKAKQTIETNKDSINQLKQEVSQSKKTLLVQPTVVAVLNRLQDDTAFAAIEREYRHLSFWYPSIQLGFQALFLLPLILISLAIHRFAVRKNYGLVALITWHLLIISVIPALLKIFEFLQVGVLVQWITTTIGRIFGGLLFLVSYIQILLIPLAGFALIKFIQRFSKRTIVSPQVQAATRILESRCLSCAKKIRPEDAHCPHCGYQQYEECPHCHTMTHRHMPHCTHCGGETQFTAS